MKCPSCNSCIRLVRIDYETQSYKHWYCALENRAWDFGRLREITDINTLKDLKDSYTKTYGQAIH